MGLREFLFGPSIPDEGTQYTNEEPQPHFGHLADRDNLARELQERRGTEQRAEEQGRFARTQEEPEDEPEEPEAPRKPRLWGFRRSSRRLAEEIRRGGARPPVELSSRGRFKLVRRIEKLNRSLEEAGSPEELRDIARAARRSSPNLGSWKKIERSLEKGKESYFKKLELGGASKSQLRAAERKYEHKIGRFQRQLGRRMLRPGSQIRF